MGVPAPLGGRLVAEAMGSLLLSGTVIGSGILAAQFSADAPGFIAGQFAGALAAWAVCAFLFPKERPA